MGVVEDMRSMIELTDEPACEDLQTSLGAGVFLKKYLESLGSNPTQAAAVLGVNSSTTKRLCDGGALTIEMAAKLHKYYNLCSYDLFELEASRKATKARQLIEQGLV
tara:strand:- start:142310 stop:142630 length:321 start_codon:yes stop_codon:yes gene_type:complete